MEEKLYLSKVVMNITHGCLVVPIQGDLYDESVIQMQKEILERVKTTGIKGVIIDLAGVDIIDSFFGQVIYDTAKMASLLGAITLLVGIKPEVVVTLVDLGFEFKDIQTALDLEDGFRKLESISATEEMLEEADGEIIEEMSEETGEADDEFIEELENA